MENKKTRQTATGSARRSRQRAPLWVLSFGEVDETGREIFPFDVWLRRVCDYYLKSPEVIVPELRADGQPALDNWSRPRETAPDRHILGSKPGAVWMTRQMFQYAWDNTFPQLWDEEAAKREEALELARLARLDKRHEKWEIEQLNSVRADHELSIGELLHKDPEAIIRYDKDGVPYYRSSDNNHPMDTQFRKLVKNGDVLYHGKRRYMINPEMLVHLNRFEVHGVHLDRGARWEGLEYRNDDPMLPMFTFENFTGPRMRAWKLDILNKLEQYLLFDAHTVMMLADQEGLLEDSRNPDTLIAQHLTNWRKRGDIEQVAPRLFRATRSILPDHGYFVPKIPQFRDWFWAFCLHWSKEQIDDPDAFFDTDKILLDLHSTPEWTEEHIPDGLSRATISSRLSNYRGKHLINHVQGSRYQLSEDLLDIFRPLHQSPVNIRDAALEVVDFFTAQSSTLEPWWFYIRDIEFHFPEYERHQIEIMDWLNKAELIEPYRDLWISRTLGRREHLYLPTEKAARRIGVDPSRWLAHDELPLDEDDKPVRRFVERRSKK